MKGQIPLAKLKKNSFFKALALMLTLVILAGVFAGCGKEVEEETTTQTTTPPTTQAPVTEPYLSGNINPLTGEAIGGGLR